jgi:hypothetical protein
MAEEFTLSVGVDADMTKFRQTLRQELEAAARQQATVPVGATAGAAGTTAVPPGGVGVSPAASLTASTVAQQSTQAAATAAARASAPRLPWETAASVFGSDVVGNYRGVGPGAGGMVGTMTGGFGAVGGLIAPTAGPLSEGRTQGASPDQWWNYFGGGQGGGDEQQDADRRQRRYNSQRFRAIYFANAGARLFSNETEYGKNLRMAGSDPQELIAADIKYRQGIADAFPIAGRAGIALNDLFTGGTEPVERTLRDADRQNEHTKMMRTAGEMSREYRFMGERAGARGSALARVVAEQDYQSQVYTVQNAQAAAAEETHKRFEQQRDEAEESVRFTAVSQGREAILDMRLGAIQTAENDAVAKLKARSGPMLSSAQAAKRRANFEIDRQVQAADLQNLGAARGSLLRAADRPFEASVSERFTAIGAELLTSDDNKASIGLKGAASMAELFADMFRDVSHSHRQLTAQNRITQKLLDRDPLGAKITAIQTETDEGVYVLRGLPSSVRGPLEGAVRRGGALRESLLRREDDDARTLRIDSLLHRAEHFNLLAENKPYTAQARDIRAQTQEDVATMQQSKRYTQEEIRFRLAGGIAEEKAFETQLKRRMNAGMGMEVASGSFARGGGDIGSIEPIVNGLSAVKTAVEEMKAAFNALAGSP